MTDTTMDPAGGAAPAPGQDSAATVVNKTADKVKSAVQDQAGAAKDKADALASTVSDQAAGLKDRAGEVGRTVADKATQARDWAGEQAGVARDWALDQTDVLRDTVQTKPFIAVGVSAASAFAAGLILGVLLTRR